MKAILSPFKPYIRFYQQFGAVESLKPVGIFFLGLILFTIL